MYIFKTIPRHVLTAGHCVEGVDNSTLKLVEVLFKWVDTKILMS
jgi:hypothetical protein